MRQSHSYSKRDLLETCARRYFYEYYAAALKPPPDQPSRDIQRSLFDEFEPVAVVEPFSEERIHLARRLKQLSGCFLLAGDILHKLIALHLKKKSDWPVEWFLDKARARFGQAVTYSRDSVTNASLAEQTSSLLTSHLSSCARDAGYGDSPTRRASSLWSLACRRRGFCHWFSRNRRCTQINADQQHPRSSDAT